MNRFAFTLVELLIVVAIISILLAIAIPAYRNAVVNTKLARAKADMEAIHKAVTMEFLDDPQRKKVDRGPYCGIYKSLTSPIPYLTSVDQAFDVFGKKKLKQYIDNPFEEALTDNLCYQFYWGLFGITKMNLTPPDNNIQWIQYRIALGPDEIWRRGIVGDIDRVPYMFYYRGDAYDPSNGIISRGDLMYTNYDLDRIFVDYDQFP